MKTFTDYDALVIYLYLNKIELTDSEKLMLYQFRIGNIKEMIIK